MVPVADGDVIVARRKALEAHGRRSIRPDHVAITLDKCTAPGKDLARLYARSNLDQDPIAHTVRTDISSHGIGHEFTAEGHRGWHELAVGFKAWDPVRTAQA